MLLVASVSNFRLNDPSFGEVFYMYSDRECFISVESIVRIFGNKAAPFLEQSAYELCYGLDHKNILYAPARIVLEIMDHYEDSKEEAKKKDDSERFFVANCFAKWVHLQIILAEAKFEEDQKESWNKKDEDEHKNQDSLHTDKLTDYFSYGNHDSEKEDSVEGSEEKETEESTNPPTQEKEQG